jgi:hypothetical protein
MQVPKFIKTSNGPTVDFVNQWTNLHPNSVMTIKKHGETETCTHFALYPIPEAILMFLFVGGLAKYQIVHHFPAAVQQIHKLMIFFPTFCSSPKPCRQGEKRKR